MTQVPAGLGAEQRDPAGAAGGGRRGRGGYLALLRTPGAAQFCLAGMVGRAPMAMFGLGTILLIAASTGRYGLGGTVAAAGAVGYALCAALVARLADRFGQHRVLRPLVAIFGASCAALIICAELRAPVWALLITGGLAGASMPSLGSMVRARWSALLGDSAALHSAFALESVVDEMIFVVGPAVVTLLATSFPPAGVLVCMILSVVGTLVFAAQRRTEPAVTPQVRQETRARGKRTAASRLPATGLATMAPAYLCLGAMFASIDLSTVDFAQRHGHKPLAGLILGTYALGSAVGGLWYGSRAWRAPLERRFLLTLGLTVAGVATFWAQPGLISLDLGVLVAGLTISPTLIAGYGLIERQAPPDRRTEAMTWLSSAVSVGVAVGSAATGRIVDDLGPRWSYGLAALFGMLALSICWLGRARLRATGVTQAAEWFNAEDGSSA